MAKSTLQKPVQPNVVSMVDIIVLFFLFLMLNADISRRKLEGVALPKAERAVEDKASAIGFDPTRGQQMNINICHNSRIDCPTYKKAQDDYRNNKFVTSICLKPEHWMVTIRGDNYFIYSKEDDWDKLKAYIKREARKVLDPTDPDKRRSNRLVQINADAGAYYGMVQEMMMLSALGGGLYKMEFGLCSIHHFKALEGKRELWLPKEKGLDGEPLFVEDIRIFLKWDKNSNRTIRQVGPHTVNTDDELKNQVQQLHRASDEVPVEIDAEKEVPWAEVITAMDLCKQLGIKKIEFVASIGYRIEKYK